MGMKNPLHRKKLQLALRAFATKNPEKSSELDYIWVTRKTLQQIIIVTLDINHIYKVVKASCHTKN